MTFTGSYLKTIDSTELVGFVVPILFPHLLGWRMPLPGVGCSFLLW